MGTLINLIKTNHVYIYGIIENNALIACYLFKYQHLIYNNNEHTIECIGSISISNTKNLSTPDNSQFISGFKTSLDKVIKKSLELNRPIKRILIENISHNNILLDYVNKIIKYPYLKTPCAFFLYNYISYTKQASSCFILY